MKPFKEAHSVVSVTGYEIANKEKLSQTLLWRALFILSNDHNHIYSFYSPATTLLFRLKKTNFNSGEEAGVLSGIGTSCHAGDYMPLQFYTIKVNHNNRLIDR